MKDCIRNLFLVVCAIEYCLFTNADSDPLIWEVEFVPGSLEINMDSETQVLVKIFGFNPHRVSSIKIQSENSNLAEANKVIANTAIPPSGFWNGNITVKGVFLGQTKVYVELTTTTNEVQRSPTELNVVVIREVRVIDHIFVGSVALLVSLLYINFGAALDLTVLSGLVKRPIGPCIGFASQFIVMPLLSFGLGYLLFPDSVEMQLGLFFTGVSPSGGASNIWAVLLGGNINLSVLMTTISNITAFGMMPLWIFTLGQVIFNRGNLAVPYERIATFAVSLVVPLIIGLAIQKWSTRLTRVLVRSLKPISTLLILFIVIFAIVTNLYLFQLFSWKIVVSGLGLPWLGYLLGWLIAKTSRQTSQDALTIAIETGVQNTGIAIFLLRLGLPQPQADLTTVIPVSVAIMTPFPLLILYLYKKIISRNSPAEEGESQNII